MAQPLLSLLPFCCCSIYLSTFSGVGTWVTLPYGPEVLHVTVWSKLSRFGDGLRFYDPSGEVFGLPVSHPKQGFLVSKIS
jgi:hypothetical protein